MVEHKLVIVVSMFGAMVLLLPNGFVLAQVEASYEEPPAVFTKEVPQSPVRDELIKLLRPEKWLESLQQYIKAPLPSTDIKSIDINEKKVSDLNTQISRETGVDILKFFQFVGKILVIFLEGAARLIRLVLPAG